MDNFRLKNSNYCKVEKTIIVLLLFLLCFSFYVQFGIGFQSVSFNTTGNNKVPLGYQSLIPNTPGSNNIANGTQPLNSNATGSYNIGHGLQPLFSSITDNYSFHKIIKAIKTQTVPLIDSTNFNNYIAKDVFNETQIKILQLKKIYPKIDNDIKFESVNNDGKPPYNYYQTKEDFKVTASYKLEFSKGFHIIVLTILKGENEMESVLISYDLIGEIINFIVISYDEVAEGMFKMESRIEHNKMTKKSIVYMEEKNETIEKFIIDHEGKIQLMTSSNTNLLVIKKSPNTP